VRVEYSRVERRIGGGGGDGIITIITIIIIREPD